MLKITNLTIGYDKFIVAESLNLEIKKGSIYALIGPNGAGKTSLIMSIAGHVEIKSGTILLKNKDITHTPPHEKVKLGIALAPEGRKLFTDLTVEENLILGNFAWPKKEEKKKMEFVFTLFPKLKERLKQIAGTLSGGEQQMLSIARALMANPEFLMIDEVSLGLMPKAVNICYDAIKKLKKMGITTLIVEQNTNKALQVADKVGIMVSGKIVWEGTGLEAKNNYNLLDSYLGLKR